MKDGQVVTVPAALLAEAALHAGDDNLRALGVRLADPMAAVVVLGQLQVEGTALDLAAGVLHIVVGRRRPLRGRGRGRQGGGERAEAEADGRSLGHLPCCRCHVLIRDVAVVEVGEGHGEVEGLGGGVEGEILPLEGRGGGGGGGGRVGVVHLEEVLQHGGGGEEGVKYGR